MKLLCIVLAAFLHVCILQAQPLKSIHIEVDQTAFDDLYEHWSQDNYIPVGFSYQGVEWSEVSMRIRGDGSREFPKKSLKLRFDDQPFVDGRDRLNVNAEYLDMSYMHAVVSSELFREAGIPCFSAEHVLVYLNGELWGVYVLTENMDEKYLSANGLDPSGLLYKATKDGACMNLYEDVTQLWEIKNNVDAGWNPLKRFIHELNHVPDDQFVEWLHKNVDIDNYYTSIIMNALLGSGSTYYHNYFMYNDIYGSGKWMYLPWDLDQTMGTYHFMNYPITRSSNEYNFDNPWAERAWIHPVTRAALIERLHELGTSVFNPENVFPRMDSLQTLLHPYVLIDETDQVETSEKYLKECAFNYKVVESRYNLMVDQLERWPTPFAVHRTHFNVVAGEEYMLSWNSSSSPTGNVTYEVSVGTDRRFYDPETIVVETEDTEILLEGLEPGTYFWRVYAKNEHGATLGFSKPEFFEVVEATVLETVATDVELKKADSPFYVPHGLTIPEGSTVTIEPGSIVMLGPEASIHVRGVLVAQGTGSDSIVFTRAHWNSQVGHSGIRIDGGRCELRYCVIEGAAGSAADDIAGVFSNVPFRVAHSRFQQNNRDIFARSAEEAPAVVTCTKTLFETNVPHTPQRVVADELRIDSCEIRMYSHMGTLLFAQTDVFEMSHSNVYGGDNLLVGSQAHRAEVSYSSFEQLRGVFAQNIDTTSIRHSVVSGADIALYNVKNIDHCTLWNNTTDIAFDKAFADGADARISNTILQSKSVASAVQEQVTFAYCLSPTDDLEMGIEVGEPNFVNSTLFNYHLQPGSLAINAGDPDFDKDPDGSRSDIGARWFDSGASSVVINEINYKSSLDANSGDWVEIYNPSDNAIHIGGWKLTDGDEGYVFPAGFTLAPHDFVVVAREPQAFTFFFGGAIQSLGPMNFGLSGQGETVYLKNQVLTIIDSVAYDDDKPWPEGPDGHGSTLELIHSSLDNNDPYSWQQSMYNWGSPGMPNSVQITDYDFSAKHTHVFPNPVRMGQSITLYSEHAISDVTDAYIADALGSIRKFVDVPTTIYSGEVQVHTHGLAPGMYYLTISNSQSSLHLPFLVL